MVEGDRSVDNHEKEHKERISQTSRRNKQREFNQENDSNPIPINMPTYFPFSPFSQHLCIKEPFVLLESTSPKLSGLKFFLLLNKIEISI